MYLVNRTENSKVESAIKYAMGLLNYQSNMMQELAEKDDFKYNSGTGREVVDKIRSSNKTMKVFFYRPWNLFTKAMGYSNGKDVYINERKLDSFTYPDLVGLLLHEGLHGVGFSHGNNYKTEEKCNHSVNYYVSENIQKWL
jgi:hypothetical protein